MRKFNKEECIKLVQHALSERDITEFNTGNISVEGVNKFLNTIDARHLHAYVERVFENKTYRDIGEPLGVTAARARELVYKAARYIRYAYNNGFLGVTELSFESPIDYLNLSTRTRNALIRRNVKTVGQLIGKVDVLNDIDRVGKSSEKEIREKLVAFGFDLPER